MDKQYNVTLVGISGDIWEWMQAITCTPNEWLGDIIMHNEGMIPVPDDRCSLFISIKTVARLKFEEIYNDKR